MFTIMYFHQFKSNDGFSHMHIILSCRVHLFIESLDRAYLEMIIVDVRLYLSNQVR